MWEWLKAKAKWIAAGIAAIFAAALALRIFSGRQGLPKDVGVKNTATGAGWQKAATDAPKETVPEPLKPEEIEDEITKIRRERASRGPV
jgi:hypothetical protein